MESYDIASMSTGLRQMDSALWERIGWMRSVMNQLTEQEDKESYSILVNNVTVFLRKNFDVAVRDEVKVANLIAEQSRQDQNLKPR